MNDVIRPVLTGHKALVVGVANDQSIAYGCAKAFRDAGAELAVTWLNDKARPHVEPDPSCPRGESARSRPRSSASYSERRASTGSSIAARRAG